MNTEKRLVERGAILQVTLYVPRNDGYPPPIMFGHIARVLVLTGSWSAHPQTSGSMQR